MYSAGKGLLALLALQLVDDGTIALDRPVAELWPEFAVGGKETATVAHLLTHRAGVPAIRALLTDEDLHDWDVMTAALAATEAWWVPGERLAYHTNTFGHLVGELVRRASGQPVGDRLRAVAEPLGADVWFGVPAAEQHRCADIVWDPARPLPTVAGFAGLEGDVLMNALAHLNPPGYSSVGLVNTPAWRSLPLGSTSGHASASGLARIYAALLEPGRLLSPDLLAHATAPRATGRCPILGDEVTFGLGFQPTTARRPLGPNPRGLRALRDGRRPGLRRSRCRGRLRVRHEPRGPPLAERSQPDADRRRVRRYRQRLTGWSRLPRSPTFRKGATSTVARLWPAGSTSS